jgi:osmotically-inducible protein OsmY
LLRSTRACFRLPDFSRHIFCNQLAAYDIHFTHSDLRNFCKSVSSQIPLQLGNTFVKCCCEHGRFSETQTLTNQGKEGELPMSNRYEDREHDRGQRSSRNFEGRRSGQQYDHSYGQGGGGSAFDDDQRYAGESRWRGQQFGTGRAMYGSGGDYESSNWGSAGEDDRYSNERNRNYGSSGRGGYSGGGGSRGYGREYGGTRMSRGYEGSERSGETYGTTRYGDDYGSNYGGGFERGEGQYRDTTGDYSQRSSYPRGYQSGSSYGQSGRSYGEYDRREGRRYGQDRDWYEGRGPWEGRGGYEGRERYEGDRGWWDRLSDTVASWFGDEEAERRRQMERPYQGRGPKGYRRSDDRIKEDVNDRLSEGYLDATEIDVSVSGSEVVLTGTVNSRTDKRRAEDIAEHVAGVTNVENRLRVRDRQQVGGTYGISEGSSLGTTGSSGLGATGTTGTTNTTGTSATGTGTTGTTGTSTTARGKTASS